LAREKIVVIAEADLANAASVAVMQRLGMHFHKDVQYPLGAEWSMRCTGMTGRCRNLF
jgi:RimJ/RimL family protein N-acetyltransferase